uniref:ABM domain-containing protein n=1 Tax=Craspedostauros australis TaxID=1486917 RepID=A0A7R9WPV4_9STRA|mmetsp:Transcript_15085/g.41764  ORF Transcript_15085/g.41764 Transcript_15085/m.41764 type:complete len:189 (+) Transcript_15085:77-643(+)
MMAMGQQAMASHIGTYRSAASRRDDLKQHRRNRLVFCIIPFATLFFAYSFLNPSPTFLSSSATTYRKSNIMSADVGSTAPFSLMVTLQFTEAQYKDQFLLDIAPLAKFVKEKEPDTTAYEVLLSDKDPLHVLIMERYKDKENAFEKVHRSSAAYLEFRPKLGAMIDGGFVKMDGHSYVDSMVGFGDRL